MAIFRRASASAAQFARAGATNLATNSSLDYDLSGLNFDSAHARLTLGTNLNVNLNLLAGFTLGTYNLVTSTGITGSPTFTVSHSGPGDNPAFGGLYSVPKVGNNIVLVVTAPVQTWKGNGQARIGTRPDVNWTPTSLNGGVYADNSYQEVFVTMDLRIAALAFPPMSHHWPSRLPIQAPCHTPSPDLARSAVTVSSPSKARARSTSIVRTLTPGRNEPTGWQVEYRRSWGGIGTGTLSIAGGSIDNAGGFATLSNNLPYGMGRLHSRSSERAIWTSGRGLVPLTTTPTVTVTNNTLTVSGSIGDGGTGSIRRNGSGTLSLAGANTYSGATTVLNGTLNVTGAGTLGGGSRAAECLGRHARS